MSVKTSNFIEQGWLANIAVSIFVLSLTQKSLFGIFVSSVSVAIFLITLNRFKNSTDFDRVARKIGNVVGAFCLATSVFWSFEETFRTEAPAYAVAAIESEIRLGNGMITVEFSPSDGFSYRTIIGLRNNNKFNVVSVESIYKKAVDNIISHASITLQLILVIMIVVFILVIILGKFAMSIQSVQDRGE